MRAEISEPTLEVRIRVEAHGLNESSVLSLARTLTLGRDDDCDVVLPSSTISRKHASLFARDGHLFVRDHSSNGTRVDGALLHLAAKDVGEAAQLELGPYRVRIDLHSQAARSVGSVRALSPTRNQELRKSASPELRKRIRAQLLESLDLVSLDRDKMSTDRMRPKVIDALTRITEGMGDELPRGEALQQLLDELCHEVLGLGPLEPLLADAGVSEIMVVDPATIYVERNGRIELASSCFTDDTAVRAVLERIVTPLGRRIDESNPIVDARLKDGSRVNAVIPPLALKGPCITIRKFPSSSMTLDGLVQLGSLSVQMARFLARAVHVRVNVVIAGGTGSGKTTLLNVLSAAIPSHERIVTIEDAAELRLAQRHVVSLESRPPNMEGAGAVSIRDLVKNALRMRPDRIVVGECRGGEALDMLAAMNTGHEGSMTTTHANSPSEAVQRIETLCLMAGLELPVSAIRRQIAASIDLIVQQARFSDGSRRITHVSEVVGLSDSGEVELRDVFRFVQTATDEQGRVQGHFYATGFIPQFVDRFLTSGLVSSEAACL